MTAVSQHRNSVQSIGRIDVTKLLYFFVTRERSGRVLAIEFESLALYYGMEQLAFAFTLAFPPAFALAFTLAFTLASALAFALAFTSLSPSLSPRFHPRFPARFWLAFPLAFGLASSVLKNSKQDSSGPHRALGWKRMGRSMRGGA